MLGGRGLASRIPPTSGRDYSGKTKRSFGAAQAFSMTRFLRISATTPPKQFPILWAEPSLVPMLAAEGSLAHWNQLQRSRQLLTPQARSTLLQIISGTRGPISGT